MTENKQASLTDMEGKSDLKELWILVTSGWKLIVVVTTLTAIGSLVYGFSLIEIYRSEALLAPVESEQVSNSLLSQFGAVAGFVGVNVSGRNLQVHAAIATLQSRQFLNQFITSHQILPLLLASEWNVSGSESEVDANLFNAETGAWPNGQPTDEDAFKAFREILTVSENSDNGMVTVAIEWYDPELAQQWVQWLVEDINELHKEQDRQTAQRAIEYLQHQLSSTQLIEMQNVIYRLIESQMHIVMLGDVRDEYVFKVVDPAYRPETRIWPQRGLILMVGLISGLLGSILFLMLKSFRVDQPQHTHGDQEHAGSQ